MDVKLWYPLLTPQILFKDRQKENNAYLETNPAIYVKDDIFIILVRLVNYRKFCDRSFKMGGTLSESLYHKFTARYTDTKGFEILTSSPVVFINKLPQYYSCWTGYEDIRFIDDKNILCTSPTSSQAGNPVIVTGILEENTITITQLCMPHKIEKNWMPFRVGATDFVLYSVYPLAIKNLTNPTPRSLHTAEELKGYHGSTNGIHYNKGYLFIIHIYTDRTYHRWLYFDPINNKYGFSKSFTFHDYSYIEFTCSLVVYKERLFVGLGVNDDKAYICEVSHPVLTSFTYYEFAT